MVSLVIISHSEILAKGVAEIALEMAPEVKIKTVGGNEAGKLGTDYNKIYDAIEDVYSDDGIVILFDLGSSLMTSEIVVEEFKAVGKCNICIVDAPIVEGSIIAAIEASLGSSIEKIIEKLEPLKMGKIR